MKHIPFEIIRSSGGGVAARSRRVYRMRHEVTDTDTAAALGSGDVPVLATPRLIAWMEAATVRAAAALLGTARRRSAPRSG